MKSCKRAEMTQSFDDWLLYLSNGCWVITQPSRQHVVLVNRPLSAATRAIHETAVANLDDTVQQ